VKLLIDKILSLDDGEHHYAFDVPAREIGMDLTEFEGHEIFDHTIHADVTLTKTSHLYCIRFRTTSEPRFLCDRCLAEVRRPVEGEFMAVYSDLKAQSGNAGEEVRLIDVRRSNEIALNQDVMDTLMLAVPSKILCREDCLGLCDQCGADLNQGLCEHRIALNEER
jgi:uncharacterized protein